MSQQKRPDQGDAINQRARVRNAVGLILQGPAAYTDLDNIQNIQNPFPQRDFDTRHRHDNPGKDWEIVTKTRNGVNFWVTIDLGVGRGAPVTRQQQIQQQDWQRKIGERATDEQWPITEDRLRKSDEISGIRPPADPTFIAWQQATKDRIFPPHTSTLASNSNSSTTSHSGGGTHTAGSQYSGGAQYQGGEGFNSGGASYYRGGAQYPGGESSNSGSASYYRGGAQYPGGESSNSGGTSYNTGDGLYSDEPARTPGYYDPTIDPSEGGQPRQNPSSGTSGRGAGYSGRRNHRQDPY
ncbi:hypothetical protein BHYA_0049g00560 [Botrytis hyacinthi]|uniref:Uncharacterized protein n=1 Tax=Botrytis hyacinthi TaxID=278943 RepID=A0A4Z1GX68_9HELO|nr:hypothetical protein BHYA_0049g00560 [Botrytis hyacinthi]